MSRIEPLVLVVEDNPAMLRFTRRALDLAGLAVVVAEDGPSALTVFQTQRPDLVVLDIGIPKMDGFEVCRNIRAHGCATIMFVTARGGDADIIKGFEAGADDYLIKPFAGSVLIDRAKSMISQTRSWAGLSSDRVECGDLVVDLVSQSVTLCGDAVDLTPTEYKLLALLGRFGGEVLTFQEIFAEVWGVDHVIELPLLGAHIIRLREKIEPEHINPTLLQAVPGIGYRFSGLTPSN